MWTRDFCVGLGLVAAFCYARYHQRRRSRLPLPPGPPKLPVIGHLLQLPAAGSPVWETWAEWTNKYGSDVLHVEVPLTGTSLIIINSLKTCKELFEKRSSIYSSRPRFPMAGELVGWDWQFLIQPYNQKWRDQRKLFTQYFHPSKTNKFYPVLQQQAHLLLKGVMDAPETIQHHLQNAVASMAIVLAYGIHVSPHGDPHVLLAERALDGFGRAATPGAFLVDVLPFLKHVPSFVPGAGFQKQAAIWRQWMLEFVNSPFVTAQKEIEEGVARASFTSHYLDNNDGSKLTPEYIENVKEVAATVFTAAAHTTTSLLCTFTLAMILFPEVQKKIQDELDRAVGQDRLPGFEDLDALPYLVATIKEAARWNPPTPLAVPHSISEDDEFNGYHIPKGSTVIGNAWAILHSEEHYKDPMVFKPERFLTEDGKLDLNVLNPFDVAFGFGRRTCPGVHIAFAISYICTASLLSVFNITKTVDQNGNVIEVPGTYEQIIVLQPGPFKSILTPRNKDVAKLVTNLA